MNTAKEIVTNKNVETDLAAEEMAVASAYRYCKELSRIITVYIFKDGSYLIEDGSKVIDYSSD